MSNPMGPATTHRRCERACASTMNEYCYYSMRHVHASSGSTLVVSNAVMMQGVFLPRARGTAAWRPRRSPAEHPTASNLGTAANGRERR